MHKKLQSCPYLDLADVRCSGRFTMHNVAEAYRYCFGQPHDCPVHSLLAVEQPCSSCRGELQEVQAA